jgi:hypothetical protein
MHRFAHLIFATALLAGPAWSKEAKHEYTPEEAEIYADMRALQGQLGAGKRAFIEEQLVLAPTEAAKFWPVYDAHQAGLAALNKRRLDNILAYARDWNAETLDDNAASTLAKEALDIEKDEAALMEHTYRKLKHAVPAIKAVRYLQIESKVRAIVRFEQAAEVPLIP